MGFITIEEGGTGTHAGLGALDAIGKGVIPNGIVFFSLSESVRHCA